MYSLFSDPEHSKTGLLGDADLLNIERQTVRDVERVIEYFRYGSFFTRSDHLLVKLISTIATPLSYEPDRYLEVTRARALHVATSLQLTTSINRGKWFSGIFYYGCPELLLAYVGNDSAEQLLLDWRNLQPVKVLESPISNLQYLPPTGVNQQDERGLAVLGIDLIALMLQYYGFMQWQINKQQRDSTQGLLGPKHFIAKYVLPNMLKSQTDRALFNRCYNRYLGLPQGRAYRKLPFMVTDYTERLDKRLDIYLERLDNSHKPYVNYLDQLPRLFSDLPWGMPDIANTRQVWWALFLTRMKDMELLIELGGKEGLAANRHHLNRLKIEIKRFNSDRIYESVLPEELLDKVHLRFALWKNL